MIIGVSSLGFAASFEDEIQKKTFLLDPQTVTIPASGVPFQPIATAIGTVTNKSVPNLPTPTTPPNELLPDAGANAPEFTDIPIPFEDIEIGSFSVYFSDNMIPGLPSGTNKADTYYTPFISANMIEIGDNFSGFPIPTMGTGFTDDPSNFSITFFGTSVNNKELTTQSNAIQSDTYQQKQSNFELQTVKPKTAETIAPAISTNTTNELTSRSAIIKTQETPKIPVNNTTIRTTTPTSETQITRGFINKTLSLGQKNTQPTRDAMLITQHFLHTETIDTCKNSIKLTKEELHQAMNGKMPILKAIMMEYLPILTANTLPVNMPVANENTNKQTPVETPVNNLPQPIKFQGFGVNAGTVIKQNTTTKLHIQKLLNPIISTFNAPVNYTKTGLSPPELPHIYTFYPAQTSALAASCTFTSSKITVSSLPTVSFLPTVSHFVTHSNKTAYNLYALPLPILIRLSGFFCLYNPRYLAKNSNNKHRFHDRKEGVKAILSEKQNF
jgi:hypothetical protein